jgi:hypothetical protein
MIGSTSSTGRRRRWTESSTAPAIASACRSWRRHWCRRAVGTSRFTGESWIAAVLAGRLLLPPPERMRQAMERPERRTRQRFPGGTPFPASDAILTLTRGCCAQTSAGRGNRAYRQPGHRELPRGDGPTSVLATQVCDRPQRRMRNPLRSDAVSQRIGCSGPSSGGFVTKPR